MGFGDRLESLKMCVMYAQNHNLQIYVDWSDSIWTHGGETFYTYFKLVNIPVLNSLEDIPVDATFFPKYWNRDNVAKPLTQEIIDNDTEIKINLDLGKEEHKTSDVVVFSCIRNRIIYPESSFFARVFRVVNPDLLSGVKTRLATIPLHTAVGIHARGTDRAKHHIRKEHSIQFMALAAMPFSSKQMIAVGDDAYSIELWKRYYPTTHVFTNIAQSNTTNKGNHLASKHLI